MRIAAGQFKGRTLDAPEGTTVRPTGARVRESLFQILANWGACDGAVVLDACCGTGALGLEAMSQGARRVAFLDLDGQVLAVARANAAKLGLADAPGHSLFIRGDITQPPTPPQGWAADLVLLDAPYNTRLSERGLPALAAAGWIAHGATVVVELDHKERFTPPAGFTVDDDRKYGKTRLVFLLHTGDATEIDDDAAAV